MTSRKLRSTAFTAEDSPDVLRLSVIVLRLALANFLLSIVLQFVGYVFVDPEPAWVGAFVFYFLVSALLLFCGIAGVRTRNAACSDCCTEICGYLVLFHYWYIILSVVSLVSLVFGIRDLTREGTRGVLIYGVVSNAVLAVLQITTARYSRLLLNAIGPTKPKTIAGTRRNGA